MNGIASAFSRVREKVREARMRAGLLLCVGVVLALTLSADEVADSRKLQQEAFAAYKAKDYPTFLTKIAAASDLRPGQSTILYYRAAALALNGRREESLDALERIARMGMVYDAEHEGDFVSLHESPRWQSVLDAFKRNAAPIGTAETAFTIPERGIISEGLAFDSVTGDFFVSGVRSGVIWRIHKGSAKRFVSELPFGAFGMAVDAPRRILWVASSGIVQNERFRESQKDHGEVLKIDLRDGRVLKAIRPKDDGKHLFGDVAIGDKGVVYVSDSVSPSIYILRGDQLEPFVQNGPFTNMQGIAVGKGVLYVADYPRGIATVDLATRDVRYLAAPDDASLLGIDGLYLAGAKTLIATQNGTSPQRVLRLDLEGG
ncbi:MAG: hypothetical protein ACXV5L_05430, partial [Thermoanaerobaculia bacterium]